MTYNFDPEQWYANHLRLLEHRRDSGELDEDGFRRGVEELDRRLEAMERRLDGTFVIPDATTPG